ncbi:hypothetical protein ACERNI_12410 [Camelimonas sp. ID_303_24]
MTYDIGNHVPAAHSQGAAGMLPVQDAGQEGSVRTAVVALVLVVVSALAIFPFILPSIPV